MLKQYTNKFVCILLSFQKFYIVEVIVNADTHIGDVKKKKWKLGQSKDANVLCPKQKVTSANCVDWVILEID